MANLQHGKLFSFSFPLQLCISSGMYVCMYVYLYYKTVLADMIEKKWQFFRLLIQLFIAKLTVGIRLIWDLVQAILLIMLYERSGFQLLVLLCCWVISCNLKSDSRP